MTLRTFSVVLLLLLWSCSEHKELPKDKIVNGYVPVYGTLADATIRLLPPETLKNPGKIYIYGNYLLINEVNRGIHIYNNTDPAKPVAMGLAEIIGNSDMAVRNNIIYANHLGNLVALQTEDFTKLVEVGRLPISNWNLGVPPPSKFYFECVDASKGPVLSWKKQVLTNPDCYAY